MELMKVMDKHKNIINLLGVCTQEGEFLMEDHTFLVFSSVLELATWWYPLIKV